MTYFINRLFDPMGSPLSSIVSDITLARVLEMKALQRLAISPSFYVRYVDDIAYDALYIDIH